MDEATASIDHLTDSLIQKMIKTEFQSASVITIAHRLNTIIQYDRILVLADGNIVEYDAPTALLDNPNSTSHLTTPSLHGLRPVLVVDQGEWTGIRGTYASSGIP